ncbi:MAG: class I SAM-dependent methyltransferase [Caldisphaera sp.]|jgi:ubiquinone/menaquinone biosynthesis C-methylase UbiE|nr:MAG: class I SAM-dependent methyltransferase [Caldisphaera sp.]PMP90937.1 MAG: class I SAM-dependent methyltransferase [Caldisphaera sp.]
MNWVELVFDIFDIYAMRYDQWYDKHRIIYEYELNAVKSAKDRTYRPSLEIGVGSGRFAKPLNIDLGIDPSESLLKIAKGRGVNVIRSVGESLPFSNNKFNTIYILITICFLDDPIKTLKEGNRILKNKGNIIIGFVPKESKWGNYYGILKEKGNPFYKYATFYTYREILDMLEETGFNYNEIYSTLFQNPDKEETIDFVEKGYYKDAGFVVIKATKS